jgi:hypothetical protein
MMGPLIRPSEPELIRLCRAKTWIAASERTQSHPTEAVPTDFAVRGEASTAVAVAVRSRAPIQVIQGLLNANFHQVQVCHLARGSIIHEALKHRAGDDVLECLVRAVVEYEPLTGRSGSGYLLGHKDEVGRTALHYMVDRIVRSLDRGTLSQAEWDITRLLVQAHPESVSTIDADGSTPLVLLLLIPRFFYDVGGLNLEEEVFRMVQLMLGVCPTAVKVSRRLPRPWHYQFKFSDQDSMVHGDGVPSPLSCALLHGRSLETINLLLDSNKKVGVNACRAVVTHYREVPLHIAASMRCPVEVISRLVEEDAGIIGIGDTHGLGALDWVWIRHTLDWCSSPDPFAPTIVSRRRYVNNNFLDWHKRVSNEYVGIDRSVESTLSPAVRALKRRLKDDIFNRISVLLPAMAAASIENETSLMIDDNIHKFPLLHAACYANCPMAMVEIAFQVFPGMIFCRDEHLDRLPLHFAASRGGYTAQFPIGVSCNLQCLEENSPVNLVLSKFPEASRVVDGQDQLPLHIAIDYAKKVSEENRTFHSESWGVSTLEIDALLDVYPEALQRRDGKTSLFPFQQAAEGCNGNIDVTYELLRRDPSLLKTNFA